MDFIISNVLVLGIFLFTFLAIIISYTIYTRKLKKQIKKLQITALKQNGYIVELEVCIDEISSILEKKKQQKDNEKVVTQMKVLKKEVNNTINQAKTHSKVGK